MATQIKFGTSGWRAVMAEEFTFANVRRAVHGIARYVSSQQSNEAKVKVIVGRDPRFLGESFCATAAGILSSYGITPLVIAEPAPTPTISYAVIQSKADGNLFGTTYYTLVGLHALHVTAGVTVMLIVLGLALGRQVTSANRGGVGLVSWYWHFVDGVWVVVFTVVYLVGR